MKFWSLVNKRFVLYTMLAAAVLVGGSSYYVYKNGVSADALPLQNAKLGIKLNSDQKTINQGDKATFNISLSGLQTWLTLNPAFQDKSKNGQLGFILTGKLFDGKLVGGTAQYLSKNNYFQQILPFYTADAQYKYDKQSNIDWVNYATPKAGSTSGTIEPVDSMSWTINADVPSDMALADDRATSSLDLYVCTDRINDCDVSSKGDTFHAVKVGSTNQIAQAIIPGASLTNLHIGGKFDITPGTNPQGPDKDSVQVAGLHYVDSKGGLATDWTPISDPANMILDANPNYFKDPDMFAKLAMIVPVNNDSINYASNVATTIYLPTISGITDTHATIYKISTSDLSINLNNMMPPKDWMKAAFSSGLTVAPTLLKVDGLGVKAEHTVTFGNIGTIDGNNTGGGSSTYLIYILDAQNWAHNTNNFYTITGNQVKVGPITDIYNSQFPTNYVCGQIITQNPIVPTPPACYDNNLMDNIFNFDFKFQDGPSMSLSVK